MKFLPRGIVAWLLGVALIAPTGSLRADDTRPSTPAPSAEAAVAGAPTRPAEGEAATKRRQRVVSLPIYLPPPRGMPGETIGAGTRGGENATANIIALAPKGLGRTVSVLPALYWYVSYETKSGIDIAITADGSAEPLLEITVSAPARHGVHAVRLSEHAVELTEGVTYSWSVGIRGEPESRTRGSILLKPMTGATQRWMAEASRDSRLDFYLRNGFWYDAFALVSEEVAANPSDETLHREWWSLLEQAEIESLDITAQGGGPVR